MSNKLSKVVVVTNIAAPYRVELFNVMERISSPYVEIMVLFCGRNFSEREWVVDTGFQFEQKILTPNIINISGKRLQINYNLLSLILKQRPDGIISSEYSIPTAQAWLASKIIKCGFGIWTDGTAHSERNISYLQKKARKYLLRKSDVIVASSNDGIDNVLSYGVRSDHIYLSGLVGDYEKFGYFGYADRDLLRKNLQIDNAFTFIFVGSLVPGKGIHEIVMAFNNIVKAGCNARLLILGSGPLYGKTKADIEKEHLKNHVKIVGFVPPENLAIYYAIADCFVLPTFDDAFGLVIAEAAAAGLPIITSPYAGATREFVVHGENGFIVEPADIDKISVYMKKIMELSNDTLKRFRDLSLERARLWSIERSAKGFIKAAERLVKVNR